MAFKVLFLAHAPDAVKEIHQNQIDTGMYQLSTVVVKNQAEAVEHTFALRPLRHGGMGI